MRTKIHITLTLAVMMLASACAVRLADAVVQIDGNFGMAALMLLVLNAGILFLSIRLYFRGKA